MLDLVVLAGEEDMEGSKDRTEMRLSSKIRWIMRRISNSKRSLGIRTVNSSNSSIISISSNSSCSVNTHISTRALSP